ncbi:phosphoribosylamine--glycine ligase [Paenibacillus darwinianus]|uniref:Phosphoribosylamine--glycine ligase n=1 Tax=Paenibacillus darwinianus TaxID=1380763 RepID=A0A9W5S0C9_9BACL|nr:phosphoribosylamine--glycine ligase [Paenibacillus darwinianus]EXX85621.1 phosphoribosylamine--glycine ligase [Paenibacillus darwinianus]EXX85842.1 phosphoribosylamine--glycine ligase [Paenibacillus darwinianus]EXX86568.1 phosphoribosylamine--glycine ligase [Paenibacillus darwinianus]
MKIMVIGGGGREHAIVWALKKSEKVSKLYCAPGNSGIAQLAECVPIPVNRFADLIQFARDHAIDLVFVGPDDPLAAGIVDAFEEAGIPIFGPRKNAAEIEGSKIFMKELLRKYAIPTAAYETFTDYEAALSYLRSQSLPIVVKADGLAAGKGVTVARTLEEAEEALRGMMVDKVFGESGTQVVIEEFLEGQEMSILAFVDGETVRPMVPAQDHKPVFDNDEGPNTGGMGTYTPLPHIDPALVQDAIDNIIVPTAKAMVSEGRPFRGVLFAGLMITAGGVKTIEFNARMGDPETQVVLPRLKTDLVDIILAAVNGRLDQLEIEWSDEAAVCVILASEGYPAAYPKGRVISGLKDAEAAGALIFHAGTSEENGEFVTSGGRVLGVVGRGRDIDEARARAYEAAGMISFEGVHYRSDIAAKALKG